MNRTNFKVGDRVRIVSSKSTFFGHTGVITSIDGYATRLVFQVKIDYYPGDSDATFYEESLIRVGAIDEQDKLIEKYASHDSKVLAEAYTKYYKHKRIEAQTFDNPSDFVNVVFNDPATIIQWKDGTKTVVKACEGENFDPEKGLAMAIAKKALGNKGNYYETFKKWLPNETHFNNGRVNKQKSIKTDYTDYRKHDVVRTEEMYKQMLNARYGIGTASLFPDIDDVIFSVPATIVKWKDGTKTVVKCAKNENFDPEKGLAMAIAKKALGNKGNYYEVIRKWMHPGITFLKTFTVKSNGVETEINKVSSDDIIKIINTRKPDGNFYCYSKKEKKYIAVDNEEGDVWTESFEDKKSCFDWLEHKEKTV